MPIKKTFCVLLAILMLLLCACGDNAPETSNSQSTVSNTETEKKEFCLLYCESDSLNPYKSSTLLNRQLSSLLYDPLVKLNTVFQPEYVLAETIEQNGKTATLTLKDVVFSDGSPVTASDVVYSFKEATKSTNGYAEKLIEIISIKADGDKKINITLSKADPYFANLLSFPIFKADSDKLTDQNKISLPPIGSGQYILDKENEKLVTNPKYSGKKPSIDTITLLDAPDSTVVKYNIESGSVSIYGTDLADGKVPSMVGNAVSTNLNNLIYVGINMSNGKLSDAKMRYALSSAVGRDAICQDAYYSYATPATGLFNPVWDDAKGLQNIESLTNLKNTVAYLNELGYNSKNDEGYFVSDKGKVLSFNLVCYKGNERRLAAAKLIAEQLGAAGIKITLRELEWDAYISALNSKSFDLYVAEVLIRDNMDVTSLVSQGGTLSYGIPQESTDTNENSDTTPKEEPAPDSSFDVGDLATETEEQPNDIYSVGKAVEGFYSEKLSLVDIINAFNADMPIIPICYRLGITVYDHSLNVNIVSSANDVYFGIEEITIK
jgi:peptide/nickel transport system substrate-binding protein